MLREFRSYWHVVGQKQTELDDTPSPFFLPSFCSVVFLLDLLYCISACMFLILNVFPLTELSLGSSLATVGMEV